MPKIQLRKLEQPYKKALFTTVEYESKSEIQKMNKCFIIQIDSSDSKKCHWQCEINTIVLEFSIFLTSSF